MLKELIIVLHLLFGTDDSQFCFATTFAQPGDKWLGGDSPWLGRKILPTDVGVAHREFPLGSIVRIYNLRTGKDTEARVIDRGPFGRVDERGRWKNGVEIFRRAIRCDQPIPQDGWRSGLDMTQIVARRIDSDGFDPVFVKVIHGPNNIRRRLPRRKSQALRWQCNR